MLHGVFRQRLETEARKEQLVQPLVNFLDDGKLFTQPLPDDVEIGIGIAKLLLQRDACTPVPCEGSVHHDGE